MPVTKENERTYLREEERTVLQSMLQEWTDKPDKKTRDAFVSGTAVPKIQDLNSKDYGPDMILKNKVAKVQWEKRVAAVFTWFKNHKPYKDRQVFKIERKIPLRRVVGKLKAIEIEEIISSNNPNLPKGDKAYPGIYQQAVTEYMSRMSEEERQDMQEELEDWQNTGPPMDVRLKAAKKYGRKAIVNAHQLLEKEMFMSCITVSMVPDADTGVMGVTCHDYIADSHAMKHGKRFQSFPEWCGPKYPAFMQQMIDYANYLKAERSEENGSAGPTSTPIVFEAGPGELPLLPPLVQGARSEEVAKHAKEVIRAYFTRHYQLATGSESARTPWALIGKNVAQFFDPTCIPEIFELQDPSRMGIPFSHISVKGRKNMINNVVVPAMYPEAAKAALTLEPAVIPDIITESSSPTAQLETLTPKTPAKRKKPAKPKTPAKKKTQAKAQMPTQSESTPKSEPHDKCTTATESKGWIKSESPRKSGTDNGTPAAAPTAATEAIIPPIAPQPIPIPESHNLINPHGMSHFDPVLLAGNQPNPTSQQDYPPQQPHPPQLPLPPFHPSWAQVPGFTGMGMGPTQFNPAHLMDPSYGMMLHHLMSQLAGPQGWATGVPPQQPQDPQLPGFHHSIIPSFHHTPHSFS